MRYAIWIVTLLGVLVAIDVFSQDRQPIACTYSAPADAVLKSAVSKFVAAWEAKLNSDEIRQYGISQCKILMLPSPTKDAGSLTAKLGYKTAGHGLLNVRWDGRVHVELPFLRKNNTWEPVSDLAKVTAEQKPPILGDWKPDNSDIAPLVENSIAGQ